MIIYNVTILIERTRKSEFLSWMRDQHIPEVLETGLFNQAIFSKLITELDSENQGITYATQYYCENYDKLNTYYEKHADRLRKEGADKFGEDMLGFRTELEVVDIFKP